VTKKQTDIPFAVTFEDGATAFIEIDTFTLRNGDAISRMIAIEYKQGGQIPNKPIVSVKRMRQIHDPTMPVISRQAIRVPLAQPCSCPMYPGIERRLNRRQHNSMSGVVWLDGCSRVECTVRDFSSGGAGLLLPDGVSLPAEFDLTFDNATRRCVVAWRQVGPVGVKFRPAL
jgi:PilZ domain